MTQLDKELKALSHRMLLLVSDAENIAGVFSLRIHSSAGSLALRWRWRIGSRNFVEPCENEESQRFLRLQGEEFWQQFESIERQRYELNHDYSIAFHERKRCRLLVEKRQQLKAMKPSISTRKKGVNHAKKTNISYCSCCIHDDDGYC